MQTDRLKLLEPDTSPLEAAAILHAETTRLLAIARREKQTFLDGLEYRKLSLRIRELAYDARKISLFAEKKNEKEE